MPVFPKLSLRKYTSLSSFSDSPDVQDHSAKTRLDQRMSAPVTGQRSALLGFRELADKGQPSDFSESFSEEEETVKSPRLNFASREKPTEKPHLPPYFPKNNKDSPKSPDEKQRLNRDVKVTLTQSRPTLNPFFEANRRFVKALGRMGSRDNFSKLKPPTRDY